MGARTLVFCKFSIFIFSNDNPSGVEFTFFKYALIFIYEPPVPQRICLSHRMSEFNLDVVVSMKQCLGLIYDQQRHTATTIHYTVVVLYLAFIQITCEFDNDIIKLVRKQSITQIGNN